VMRQWEPGGLFYWYAMGYGPCAVDRADGCAGMFRAPHCGFSLNHSVNLFTSPDLAAWTFVGDVFPPAARPRNVYFRPQVVYNAATHRYVLWVNAVPAGPLGVPDYFAATFAVATAAEPAGPFALVTAAAPTRFAGGVGDVALLVDPADGAGYVAYAAWGAGVHAVTVERLAPDFLSSAAAGAGGDPAASAGVVTPDMFEAPLLWERRGFYYLSAGPVCCFCAAGAASLVWSAPHPLGPWTPSAPLDAPGAAGNASQLGAQNSFIFAVGDALVWAGDRWLQAADGTFAHTPQYWGRVAFDDARDPPAVAAPLRWEDAWQLDVPRAPAAAPPLTLTFAGRKWTVRVAPEPAGPGPNVFAASSAALDASGALRLRVARDAASGAWACGEVVLAGGSLGYGTYTFDVATDVAALAADAHVVLGFFTYADDTHEIDAEFSAWGNASRGAANADFAVQPSAVAANLHTYAVPAGLALVRATIIWAPARASFAVEGARAAGGAPWRAAWAREGASVPAPGREAVHMNLWLFRGAAPAAPAEAIITNFTFTPPPPAEP